jgi:hypothetical protein
MATRESHQIFLGGLVVAMTGAARGLDASE